LTAQSGNSEPEKHHSAMRQTSCDVPVKSNLLRNPWLREISTTNIVLLSSQKENYNDQDGNCRTSGSRMRKTPRSPARLPGAWPDTAAQYWLDLFLFFIGFFPRIML